MSHFHYDPNHDYSGETEGFHKTKHFRHVEDRRLDEVQWKKDKIRKEFRKGSKSARDRVKIQGNIATGKTSPRGVK